MIFLKRLTASQKRITFCMCTSEYYEFSFCWNEKKARTISYICILLNKKANIKLFCARSNRLIVCFTLLYYYILLHNLRWFTSIICFFILKALDINVCKKIQAKTNPAINHIPCHDANIGNLARANIFSAFQIMNKLSWIWHLSCKCTIHAAHIRFKVQIHQCVFVKYYI